MFHFKWMPFLRGLRFEQLSYTQKQIVNHFEFHQEITTKDLLFKNIMAYAELNKINIFDYVPLTFVVDVDSQTYSPDFEKFVLCYEAIEGITAAGDKKSPDYYKQCLKLINQKLQQIGLSKERRAVTHCKPKIVETHFAGRNIWILKPTGFNRGRGVSVFDSMEKLKGLIKFYSEGNSDVSLPASVAKGEIPVQKEEKKEDPVQTILMSVKSRTFVIQKYIERPMLIHDRKFDIRVWVLVTHEMKVYFFKEGYIRTSSATYSIDSEAISKIDVHLTNNAVQKYCQQYGAFEDGNQLSFAQFQVLFCSKTTRIIWTKRTQRSILTCRRIQKPR
eukprot:TRINITY_DN363_c0_g1_i1.p3 TRINITY_DN363_c0_g1~~TRINITY_DN363_c0_g1_i1.p3  ORF type:complete len:332 (-),score=38.28 TRINITY_DN363_c0_g1_i1:2954-3949(-)